MASNVQREEAIHIPDGCSVLAGSNVGDLASVGVLVGDVAMTHSWEQTEFKDNIGEKITSAAKNQVLDASFTIGELYADTINKLGGGLYTLTNVAGALVEDSATIVASGGWKYDKFVAFAYQNADGTSPTVNSITGGTDGPLVEDTDFFVMKNESGIWGFYVVDSATVTTESQTMTYDIDYTPTASKQLTAGDSSVTLTSKYLRFINTDSDGKTRYMDVFSASIQPDVAFGFGDQSNDGIETMEISMQGGIDSDLTAGAQLFQWVDEQAV